MLKKKIIAGGSLAGLALAIVMGVSILTGATPVPQSYKLITDEVWNWLVGQVSHPMVVRAYTLPTEPGDDAGKKISRAIAMLPAGVGGYVDATGFTNPQNLSGFTIPPGVTVELSPAFYTIPCGQPITVNQGGSFKGTARNSPGSTTLKLFNNCNHPMVKLISTAGVGQWWHHGELGNMRFSGNKQNNTSGNCVEVYGLAETSWIHHLSINDCAASGIYFNGSHSGTGTTQNVTVNSNVVAGIHIDDFKSALSFWGVGGDQNPVTALITNPNNGGGSIYVLDFKSEKNIPGPAVRIEPGSAPVTFTIAGGNSLNSGAASTTLVEIANTGNATSHPVVNINGHISGLNYPTIIDDQKAGVQVTSDPVTYFGFLSYTNGKHVRFDKNGFTQVP